MLSRRRLLTRFAAAIAGVFTLNQRAAVAASNEATPVSELRFPGDPTKHNVVFQFNKHDLKYHNAVLFSAGEMLRKYNDDITIVISVFGPGIHALGKKPLRDISPEVVTAISSMANYGVKFHVCGNTMKSLGWKKEDMLDFAEVVKVGAADMMELQEQGYSYISW